MVAPQAPPEQVVAGIEEDADGSVAQQIAVLAQQYGAAPGGDHRRPRLDERGKRRGF